MTEQITAPQMTAQTIQPITYRPETHSFDRVFAVLSVIAGYLFARFSLLTYNGFFTTLSVLLTFACCAVYVVKCGRRPTAASSLPWSSPMPKGVPSAPQARKARWSI